MNILIQIGGRRAIPVRAIPFLFDRNDVNSLSPDEVALALAWDASMPNFDGLQAYRLESGEAKTIPDQFWETTIVRDLRGLSDEIASSQVSHEAGHWRWRTASIRALPAVAFVWADDLESHLQSAFRNRNIAADYIEGDAQTVSKSLTLDFSPFIGNPDIERLVMDGFPSAVVESIQSVPPVTAHGLSSLLPGKSTAKRTWRDVAMPYVVDTLKAGGFTTAKALFNALESKAGKDSPFERGRAENRGSLVVREINQAVSLKTLQNAWMDIKKMQ